MGVLTKTDFLKFLIRYCTEKHDATPLMLSHEHAISEAYGDIRRMINLYLQDYAEERKLTKKAEEGFLKAIETDQRREFDDPVELIEHIGQIASKQPFFDCERISLAAIQGFCSDFLHRNKKAVYQEQLQHAAF